MTRVALVSCAKDKAESAVAARDLYVSDLFRKSRSWAERDADSWFILSALHGLLPPEKVIQPYNVTLHDMSRDDRRAWSRRVMRDLKEKIGSDTTVVFLAGKKYREDLEEMLEVAGLSVEVPMRGLGIGQQKKWLKDRLG